MDEDRLHTMPEWIKAVTNARPPCNVTELKSYSGLLSYYGKFLPKSSECLAPLHKLLRANVSWFWRTEQNRESKQLLSSPQVLINFNPSKPVILAIDASSHGLGAVLAHELPDRTVSPKASASHTMLSAQKNNSQLEKEGLYPLSLALGSFQTIC
jgi:hypothetical protein